MGKQHFSDDKPARRGNGGSRPDGNGRGSFGGNARGGKSEGRGFGGSRGGSSEGRSFGGPRPNADDRGAGASRSSYDNRNPGGSRGGSEGRGGYDARGGRPGGRNEGYSPARPTFGQGGGRPGGRPGGGDERPERNSYGERGNNRGVERPERGSYSGGGERRERPAYGGRPGSGKFGSSSGNAADRPQRYERGNQQSERRDQPERPPRPEKTIWQGQPVRYEGKPTVPRGAKGERNRKFIKQDPTAPAAEPRPVYTGRDERQNFAERSQDKPSYKAGPRSTDRDERSGGRDERPNRSSYGSSDERPAHRFDKGDGERQGASRTSDDNYRPRRFDGDGERGGREGSSYSKPRSNGERPANTGSGTFRERRDAMRDQVRGGRASGTSYGRGDAPGQAPDYKNLKHYEDDKNRGNRRRREEEDFGTEEMRLNRYIANAGICSRREADALIAAGEIRVNGEVVTEMGYKVQPTDTVQYGKTNLNREKLVYVLLNKPKDFITTTDDPEGRKTVMDLVANASKERIFPVGRLDRNTTGLLLFTNDGEVAQKLSHPSHKNKKIYQVELSKPLTAEHLGEISTGVELEDGKAEVDDVAVVAGNPHFVGVELHIGRNRIVRRIFEHLGYEVVALDRVQYAGITKKDLPRGKWRFLTEQEVIRLKYFM